MMDLALHGGQKVAAAPFPKWPQFAPAVFDQALEPLRTGNVNYWTGRKGREFELAFATYVGTKHSITTTNGTAALHTALVGLGIGPGDEVVCPSYTFIATAFAALQAGALPVFADVDDSHTIDPTGIEPLINHRTRAIVVVHTFGVACNMAPIMALAKKHDLYVIEDCAQALGGRYAGKMLGAVGHAGCFSFCQSKHFTTGGEGGAVTVNDAELAWNYRSIRDLGYEPRERVQMFERGAQLNYNHERVGFNYRMTEMQSAIGLVELARFEGWNLENRRRNGRALAARLAQDPCVLSVPVDTQERTNAYWWAPFTIDCAALGTTIQQFIKAVNAEGVPAFDVPWPEIYKQKAFTESRGFGTLKYPFRDPNAREIDYAQFDCEKARYLGDSTIAFPMHPVYGTDHMDLMADAFHKVADYFRETR